MTAQVVPPSHWTYQAVTADDLFLEQGDIIQPSEQLVAVLSDIHPHFKDDKYSAFLVLSQTCDLVRRGKHNQCKTNYINLAAVRPIQDVLLSLLDRHCSDEKLISGIYKQSSFARAKMLMERVVNQNEQAMGLFYLHPDEQVQIADPSVALLQVSFALKSDAHYETLRAARSGRLKHEFQTKLGWLVGNLYSRVATKDWSEPDRDELVRSILETPPAGSPVPSWVDDKTAKKMLVEAKQPLDLLPQEEVKALITQLTPPHPKETALKKIADIAAQLEPPVETKITMRLCSRLRNDQEFSALFR